MIEPKRSKYDIQIHMDQEDVHTREVRMIGPGQTVLECGCDTGYVSKALVEIGCTVTGIELNPAAADAARAFCEDVFVTDLDGFDFLLELGDRRFDVVLFGDVLEHLKDPWGVLRRARAVLNPDGRVVASIPNIAERNVVLNLLLGQFEYRERGLLDETHLRFFTAQSVRHLFEATGYVVTRIERIENEAVEREVPLDLERVPPEIQAFVAEHNPDYRTIQFLVEAHPATEVGTMAALRSQVARLEQEATELRRELTRAGDQRRELETRIAEHLEPRLAEHEQHLLEQQLKWASELQTAEAQWRERLDEHAATLRTELQGVTERETFWRQRAEETETRYIALSQHLALRLVRSIRRLLR